MMIDALSILIEACEIVMFVVAAHEAGHDLAVIAYHAIGYAEAELLAIEFLDRTNVAGR